MKQIFNANMPRGHYTPGMVCSNTLYVSGQTSADPATGLPPEGGFEAEMRMALEKMESVLKAAGCGRESVVCATSTSPPSTYGSRQTPSVRRFSETIGPPASSCR